jgi:hypothetical protein
MIKKLKDEKKTQRLIVMNGQSCDGLFENERIFFQDYVSSKIPANYKNILPKKEYDIKILSKMQKYLLETKKRFLKYYLGNFIFSKTVLSEFDGIYELYERSIKNDSTNKLAAYIVLLKFSIHGVEKIRTAAHAFDIKYYLPFMSDNIFRYSFSIPSKYKIGFWKGKRILTESYPEFGRTKIITRGFLPQKLKERFIRSNLINSEYNPFYIKNWIYYNIQNEKELK